jgi:hypothetical protein
MSRANRILPTLACHTLQQRYNGGALAGGACESQEDQGATQDHERALQDPGVARVREWTGESVLIYKTRSGRLFAMQVPPTLDQALSLPPSADSFQSHLPLRRSCLSDVHHFRIYVLSAAQVSASRVIAC